MSAFKFRHGSAAMYWDVDRNGRPRPGMTINELGAHVATYDTSLAIGAEINMPSNQGVFIGNEIQPGGIIGDFDTVVGCNNVFTGTNVVIIGANNVINCTNLAVEGAVVCLGNNIVTAPGVLHSVIMGDRSTISAGGGGCVILGWTATCAFSNCVLIGLSSTSHEDNEVALGNSSSTRFRLPFDLPVYANQAAAVAGGLFTGNFFKDATSVVYQV